MRRAGRGGAGRRRHLPVHLRPTTWRDPTLGAVSQAGLANNAVDCLAWGILPLLFAAEGQSIQAIGVLVALYPGVWCVSQLFTGAWSDRVGRKPLIVAGMVLQGFALALVAANTGFAPWAVGSVLIGLGTALVYPTLTAAVGDVAHPTWRATAVGAIDRQSRRVASAASHRPGRASRLNRPVVRRRLVQSRLQPVPRLIQLVIVAGFLLAGCRGVSGPEAGRTQLAAFVAAAGSGDVSTVRRAISAGIDVDVRDANGRTAVTAAALGEHADVVRLLVDADADINLQDADRNNALLVCGETGNVEVLREVLRAGPDLTRTNRFGGTALIPAADRGHVEMVDALLKTDIPIDHVNRLGWTALLEAVILGDGGPAHQQIVRLLIDAGANVDLADRDGLVPLEHARRRGFSEIAQLLE